jgi:hypothetical protein
MKKLYALCLLTLAAVFVDIALFHSGTVSAQSTTVHVQYVKEGIHGLEGAETTVTGTIVGFACAGGDYRYCYIATVR